MTQSAAPTPRLTIPDATQRAVSFHQQGNLTEAAAIYGEILKIDPRHFDSLHLLGVIRYQQGRAAAGLPLLEGALALQPESAEARSNYGLALRALGRQPEALKAFDQALRQKPSYPEALCNRGNLLVDLGRPDEALESFNRALISRRGFIDALVGRGIALIKLKRTTDALVAFDQALAVDPRHVDALTHRAGPLYALGRFEEAVASCDQAIAANPRHAVAYYNRGVALAALRRVAEAAASYDLAIALDPSYADALLNRGNALADLGRPEEALASFERGLALRPDDSRALNNRGNVLLALQRHDDAIAAYDRALAVDPGYADAHYNRATALMEIERAEEARDGLVAARALNDDNPDFAFNEAHARLLLGELRAGFAGFEGRFDKREQAPLRRSFSQPAWRGEPLGGKRILLHAEQGLGDTIQFVRYAALVARRGGHVLLEVQRSLETLLAGVLGVAQTIVRGDPLPAFDTHQYLVSLPHVFGTELDTIPAEIPYVAPPADRLARWQARLPHTGALRVGLVWSGNPQVKSDPGRSIGLAPLVPLVAVEGVQLVSLQREPRDADAAVLRGLPQILHLGDELTDFADTAAAIAQLDLIISSDTSVAHLAGAMGKPLWLLLKFSPDWRWMLRRDDSPWYPTAKLYRQPGLGDWGSVVERVRHDLARRVRGG